MTTPLWPEMVAPVLFETVPPCARPRPPTPPPPLPLLPLPFPSPPPPPPVLVTMNGLVAAP